IDDAEAAVDLLDQLAGAADRLDDVGAFAVMTDLVGQPAAAPVLGLVERPLIALDDLLDLRVEIGNLLLRRVGRDDVDELVLSGRAHRSPSGLSGPPSPASRASARKEKIGVTSRRL